MGFFKSQMEDKFRGKRQTIVRNHKKNSSFAKGWIVNQQLNIAYAEYVHIVWPKIYSEWKLNVTVDQAARVNGIDYPHPDFLFSVPDFSTKRSLLEVKAIYSHHSWCYAFVHMTPQTLHTRKHRCSKWNSVEESSMKKILWFLNCWI